MFCISQRFIFAVFSVAIAVLSISHNTVNCENKNSAEAKSSATVAPTNLTSCGRLNSFDDIYQLNSHDFGETLEQCDDEAEVNRGAPSNETSVLLDVYNAIRERHCAFTPETYQMEDKLIECVNKEIGFQPPFTVSMAKSHFGLNNTAALRFTDQECLHSANVLKCVEGKLSESKLSAELRGCKETIIRGFYITAKKCEGTSVRGVRGSGIRSLPSDILTVGTAVMLVKLAFFSRV